MAGSLDADIDLYLYSSSGAVADARLGIPGAYLVPGLNAKALSTTTNATAIGSHAAVLIGIQTFNLIPTEYQITRVLLTAADGFIIKSDLPSIVINGFTLARGSSPTMIADNKLAIDLNVLVPILPQLLTVQVVCLVPGTSQANFWQLSLCTETCTDASDSSVLTTFVSSGFTPTNTEQVAASSGSAGRCISIFYLALVVLILIR